MIARHWRGWTKPENAEAYEELLTTKVLPGLRSTSGYCRGYVLRSDNGEESEFVVINFFTSLEAVQRFADPDYRVPVYEPEARQLLSRIEAAASHYEVRMETTG
jgi:heme-degrading monooxygenase HmoA